MNELSGKCVNMVLSVEMGRGMEFLQYPVKIVATFNGKPLESDLVDAGEMPMFKTELVWETEKKEMRRARSANAPLRVDVQSIDPAGKKRERIGFVLLSPRCAQIIPFASSVQIPFKWYKLSGVTIERKTYEPALFLSFTIRDSITSAIRDDQPYLLDVTIEEEEEEEEQEEEEDESDKSNQVLSSEMNGGAKFPVQYLPDGYVQIGDEKSCDQIYLLSINIQVACNLDLLLPEVLIFNQNREKYFMSFKVIGINIKSKPFCRDLHANIPMNEKIVVRILSHFDTLKLFLTKHCRIGVSFFCGHDKLGTTHFGLESLLGNVSCDMFVQDNLERHFEQKCPFKFPSAHGIVPTGSNGRQPFIEVATSLTMTGEQVQSPTNPTSPTSAANPVENQTSHKKNDCKEEEEQAQDEIDGNRNLNGNESDDENDDTYDGVTETILPDNMLESPDGLLGDFEKEDGDESFRFASTVGDDATVRSEEQVEQQSPIGADGDGSGGLLDVRDVWFDDESTTKRANSDQNLLVSHYSRHNLMETCLTKDIQGEATFSHVTVPNQNVDRPKYMSKQKEAFLPIIIYRQYCLDIVVESITLKKAFRTKKISFKFKHPKAASFVASLINLDSRPGDEAILDNTRCKIFFVSSTEQIRKMIYAWPCKLLILDEEDLVLTDELDIYTASFLARDRTRCSYITECKAVRTYETLAKLSISMYLQEYGLAACPKATSYDLLPPILDEEIVAMELDELQKWKELQKENYEADLRIVEKQTMLKLQMDWDKKKGELESKLTKSVNRCQALSQELQVAVNSIKTKNALIKKENEHTLKWSLQESVQENIKKYCDFKNKELIETISKLERENEHLKEIIDDQRVEMQHIKKTALTKEQTTNLLHQLKGLEEKFDEAQKTKTYFKDQWKKAVREIHDLRSEEHKMIQERLNNQKVELSHLSLDTFVHGDVSDRGGCCDYDRGPYRIPSMPSIFDRWNDSEYSTIPPDCSSTSSFCARSNI